MKGRNKELEVSSPEKGRRIEIIVTDMRNSTWENVPQSERIQKNWTLKDIQITENRANSFSNVVEKVRRQLRSSGEKLPLQNFEISNPDFERISEENVGKLRNQESLILLNTMQQSFPFNFQQSYSTVPHTRAVTNQDGKFFGSAEHNPAAFALAELVDNALSATKNNVGKRTIEIRYYEAGEHSSVHVLDNGCGMNSETLKSSLKYKAPKESRLTMSQLSVDSVPADRNELVHPLFLNSNISKFGAGLKQAVFWLGAEAVISTKKADNPTVHEVKLSRNEMEAKEQMENEDAWTVIERTGTAGQIRHQNVSHIVKSIIETEEQKKLSFCHIAIEQISGGGDESPLSFLQVTDLGKGLNHPSIEKQLAHIYHYYLHGRNGNTGRGVDEAQAIEIIVNRFSYSASKWHLSTSTNLRNVQETSWDLETEFIRTAAPDPFLFTIEVQDFNRTNNVDMRVGGVIRYHPFQLDHETHPLGVVRRKEQRRNSIETEDPVTEEREQNQAKCKEFFHLWWNGRLIPHTKLESLDWCSPATARQLKSSDKLYNSYGRISGSIFLDSCISGITENKLNITTTEKLSNTLNEKVPASFQAPERTFKRITTDERNGTLKATRMDIRKKFREWLTFCQQYDKQVEYSGFIEIAKRSGTNLYRYGQAKWGSLILRINDPVRIQEDGKKNNHVLGKIKGFLVESKHCFNSKIGETSVPEETITAPLSSFEFELHPKSYYYETEEGLVRFKPMRLIDTENIHGKAQDLINKQIGQLRMQLKTLDWTGKANVELKEGAILTLDDVLIHALGFDIVGEEGQSYKGYLLYSENLKPKRIGLTAVVYEIGDGQNTRTKKWASDIAHYENYSREGAPNGYYFINLSFRNIKIWTPGKYVIKFQACVENITSSMQRGNMALPSTSSSTSKARRSSARLPGPTRSSNGDTGDGGRDPEELCSFVFQEENEIIPMPFHEIQFSVLPGSPRQFEIEEFGSPEEPIRIGQPFKIEVKLLDQDGNACIIDKEKQADLLRTRPSISFVVGKRARFSPTIDCNGFCVSGNHLFIQDVVAKGDLGGVEFKELKVCVGIKLAGKMVDKQIRRAFHTGNPAGIIAVHESAEMTNRTLPMLAFQIVDLCGNVIPLSQDRNKPILLTCNFFRIKNEAQDSELLSTGKVQATDRDGQPHIVMQMNPNIILPELKAGMCPRSTLICHATYENLESASMLIHVLPSTVPETIKFLVKKKSGYVEVCDQDEIHKNVGSLLELNIKIFDEIMNSIEFEEGKHTLKINWPDKRTIVSPTSLPIRITVPQRAEQRKPVKAKLLLSDPVGSVVQIVATHKFFVTTIPGATDCLKLLVNLPTYQDGIVTIQVDEQLPNIVAKLLDRYDNIVFNVTEEDLLTELSVYAEGIDVAFKTEISASDGTGSFIIKDLNFKRSCGRDNHTTPGHVMMTVKYRNFEDTLKFNFTPGAPSDILLEVDGQCQKDRGLCHVQNMSDVRIRALLVDKFQNQTNATEDTSVKLYLVRQDEWVPQKIRDHQIIRKNKNRNDEDFGHVKIGINPGNLAKFPGGCPLPQSNRCSRKCFGKLLLQLGATAGSGLKILTTCHFHVKCRSNVPYQFILSNTAEGFRYEAGAIGVLPVTVEAEDGTILNSLEEHLKLIMKDEAGSAFVVSANNSQDGIYTFGNIPTKAGLYTSEIQLRSTVKISKKITDKVQIVSRKPKTLGPEQELVNVYVSNNTEKEENQIISPRRKFYLKDEFGNMCNDGIPGNEERFMGRVRIQLEHPQLLDNEDNLLAKEYQLINAEVEIPKLMIQAGVPLENNSNHKIHLVATIPDGHTTFTHTLNFTFFNNVQQRKEVLDTENQLQEFSKKETETQKLIDSIDRECARLSQQLGIKTNQEQEIRNHLLGENLLGSQVVTGLVSIEKVVETKITLIALREREIQGRRGTESNIKISHPELTPKPQILGPIGLLAEIKSEIEGNLNAHLNLQRVLSWHLQSKLNVTVVETQEKGHELLRQFPKNEFMILDILKVKALSWSRSQYIPGPGNPVYARTLLHITRDDPREVKVIQKVFNRLLGDMIIVNTIEDATKFMKVFNERNSIRCPTILTRDGKRLDNFGIIGGTKNQVPEVGPLLKFGLHASGKLAKVEAGLKKLLQLKNSIRERQKAEKALNAYAGEKQAEYGQLNTAKENYKKEVEARKKILIKLHQNVMPQNPSIEQSHNLNTDVPPPNKRPRRQ